MTLIEIVLVVAIVGILVAVILWPFASFRDEKLLDGAAEEMMALLNEARQRTLSSDGASVYGVYFEDDKMTLFKGAAFPGTGDPDNKEASLANRLTISTISLTGGGSVLIFKRLTGATSENGSITLSLASDSSRQRIVTVSPAGSISLN